MQITGFLGTRVARRILGLFVLSSVLPLAVLAGLTYREASRRLKDERMASLEVEARQAGAAIFDRLQMIDLQLQLLQHSMMAPSSGGLNHWLSAAAEDSIAFSALAIQEGSKLTPVLGSMPAPGPLKQSVTDRLLNDRPVVVVLQEAGESSILMGRLAGNDTTVLWAKPSESVLWGFDRRNAGDPEARRICVFELQTRQTLHCSNGNDILGAWQIAEPPRLTLGWESGKEAHLASVRPLFLGFEFGTEPWAVIASASAEGYLGALERFRWTFGLVVLTTFALAFWLSNILIRRSMTPLEQLHQGTSRLASGDFRERVRLSSGDEFQELADSFNSMADSLEMQFSTLKAINTFDRSVLSAPRILPVTVSVLQEAGSLFGALWVVTGFATSGKPGRWRVAIAGATGMEPTVRDIDLEQSRVATLLTHSASIMGPSDYAHHPLFGGPVPVPERIGLLHTFRVELGTRGAGFVALGFPHGRPPASQDEVRRIGTLVDQVALGLSSVQLVEELDNMSWGAITALARAIDAKSPWTAGHSERVTNYALEMAGHLELSEQERLDLHRGGLLHDVGKIGISAAILNKPGKLSEEEMEAMRQHPVIGGRILAPIEAFRSALPVVLYHHEAWDGSGYPEGLAGEGIPRLARILAVADVFDALTSDRPYRPGWAAAEAEAYIGERGGKSFDPEAVVAFRKWRKDLRLVLPERREPDEYRREIA